MVRPSWIAASRNAGKRAMERDHLVQIRKVDPLVVRLRNSTTPKASTGAREFKYCRGPCNCSSSQCRRSFVCARRQPTLAYHN